MRMVMAAALFGLAACSGTDGGPADQNAANQAAPANASAGDKELEDPAPSSAGASNASGASATASSSTAEIRALLVGRWSEGGDCTAATDIRDDGSFASPEAGSGRWVLENEYLTLTGDRATTELAVQEIDQDSMATVNPRGHIGDWKRC